MNGTFSIRFKDTHLIHVRLRHAVFSPRKENPERQKDRHRRDDPPRLLPFIQLTEQEVEDRDHQDQIDCNHQDEGADLELIGREQFIDHAHLIIKALRSPPHVIEVGAIFGF